MCTLMQLPSINTLKVTLDAEITARSDKLDAAQEAGVSVDENLEDNFTLKTA